MARIAEVSELVPLVGVHDEGKADTDVLGLFLDGAEKFGERWTGRTFSPDPPLVDGVDSGLPVAKSFATRGRSRLIRVPDLRTVTLATLDTTALIQDSNFYLDGYVEPAIFFELVQPFTGSGPGKLTITGRWGPVAPDPDIKEAVLTLAARGYKRRDANYADVMNTATGAQFFWATSLPEESRKVFENLRIPNLLFA